MSYLQSRDFSKTPGELVFLYAPHCQAWRIEMSKPMQKVEADIGRLFLGDPIVVIRKKESNVWVECISKFGQCEIHFLALTEGGHAV